MQEVLTIAKGTFSIFHNSSTEYRHNFIQRTPKGRDPMLSQRFYWCNPFPGPTCNQIPNLILLGRDECEEKICHNIMGKWLFNK